MFAAGDVTDVPYKQIVVAMGEGSKAGLSAFDYLIRTEPARGSRAGRVTGVLRHLQGAVILTGWRRFSHVLHGLPLSSAESNPRDAINRLDELPGKAHLLCLARDRLYFDS